MQYDFRFELQGLARKIVFFFCLFYLTSAIITLYDPHVFTPVNLLVSPIVDNLKPNATAWDFNTWWYRPPQSIYVYEELYEQRETVQPALNLVKRYAADHDRIAIFIPPDSATEVLITSGKAHLYPLSYATIDNLFPTLSQRAIAYQGLKPGDIIFIDTEFDHLLPLQQSIIHRLCEQFGFQRVDSDGRVDVVRLASAANKQDTCTCSGSGLICSSPGK